MKLVSNVDKAKIVIRVMTPEEIKEVYDVVSTDMRAIFHADQLNCRITRDYALVETPIHKVTIELHRDNPVCMKGRRANLVVLKDFLPESQQMYYEIYNHMVCIGGFVINYNTFLKQCAGRYNRGIMKYDVMVNYHDYKNSQWQIEEDIGIIKHCSCSI